MARTARQARRARGYVRSLLAAAPVNVTLPTISGTAQEGQVLTVANGTWTNSPSSFTYQWLRDGAVIAGSVNQTRTLVAADIGHVISCAVVAIANGQPSLSATAAATVSIIAAPIPVPVNTLAPVVSGTAAVGSTLSTTNGAWSNSPGSYAYAWRRDGVDIAGATAATYVVASADLGHDVAVRVYATNGGGTAGATSNTTTIPFVAPVNTVAPVISGSGSVGQALTVTNGTWNNNPDSYAYQWRRDAEDIAGATNAAYTVLGADQGRVLTCRVYATNAGGTTAKLSNAINIAAGTALSAYLGQVATRSYIPNNFGSTQAQARTLHTAMDSITSLQVSYANWQVDTGTGQATNPGAVATIKVAIEYPLGTVAGTFLWSGAVSGSIPSGGTLLSDALAITIPAGAQFALRPYMTCSGNVSYMRTGSGAQFLSGEALNMGASITDQTAGGTITNNSTGSNIYPVAIVAQTTKPTFLLVGDSITAGSNDTTSGQGDTGSLARSIGIASAYINEGVSSDRAMWMSHSYQQRRDLQKYVSHVIVAYGVNDLASGGRTAAQVYADLKAIWSMFPAKTVLQTTITPSSVTTTDSYATVANQTPHSSNAARVALNGMIRSGPPGGGYIELADQVESVRDSGVFKAPGYTNDGTHPSPAGYQAILNSGAIAPLTIGATALATNLWSPYELSIDNYNLWLDASDPSTASDGSKWLPRNNFANYSQATASKQPVLTPNAINGRAAFLFDGTDDFLSGSGSMLTLTNAKATSTLAGVFLSQNTSGSNVVYANLVNSGNSTRFDLYIDGATGRVVIGTRTVDAASVVNATSAAAVNGAAAMAVGQVDVPNGAVALRVNGADDGSATVPAGAAFPATNSSAVGVGANNASAFYKGYVGEILELPRLLTTLEKQKLEGYWRGKWAIPLAAGHPYASSLPLV